jgi:hypothetical protein
MGVRFWHNFASRWFLIRRSFHIHLRGFFSSITAHVAAAVIPASATSSKTSSGVPIGVILATRVRPLARTQIPLRPAASGRQPPPLGLRPKSFDANLSDSVREGRPRHSCYRPFRSSPAWPARLSQPTPTTTRLERSAMGGWVVDLLGSRFAQTRRRWSHCAMFQRALTLEPAAT